MSSNAGEPTVCYVVGRAVKRVFDYTVGCTGIIVILPLLLLVVALSSLVQGRPIFYASERYIAKDRTAKIFKSRSMVKDPAEPKYRLKERFLKDGYFNIPIGCEVYTPLGGFLERTQIVELPQLPNIVFDGMSIVGNRALPESNVRLLRKFPGWGDRFDSPSGLTGISQVVGKFNLTPEKRMTLERLYSEV